MGKTGFILFMEKLSDIEKFMLLHIYFVYYWASFDKMLINYFYAFYV